REWEKLTERMGIWMDLDNPYITFDNDYIESLWWILKELWNKGLLYQGYKVLPYCARCGTSLSSHEVALGYRDTEDPSIFVKFKVADLTNVYFLVWTTTPWTLVANVALAVGSELDYLEVEHLSSRERFILNKESFERIFSPEERKEFRIVRSMKGRDLIGLRYEPLMNFLKAEKGYQVFGADFVSTEEGTGIVHIAPAFGEDDMALAREYDLPVLQPVKPDGTYSDEVSPWKGMWVKEADPLIIQYLKEQNKLFRAETYRHSYPFCWRCDTPLLYYAKESWFIKTTAFRELLIENNRKINWFPPHIREGRFGNFLENVVDWALSRERYWGTPLNIWVCENCNSKEAIGSIAELRSRSLKSFDTIELHRPYVDEITIKCSNCSGTMHRVKEVIDCWFDSGAMFVAQHHYPFENQEEFTKSFPADFICEAIDQTRGWFYSLHVLATLLFASPAYRNCLVTELGLDEEGQKMSKHIGNVISPWELISMYGADVLRWYVFSVSPPWMPKRFGKKALGEVFSKFFSTFWNVFNFFVTYANIDNFNPEYLPEWDVEGSNVFDRWLVARFHFLISEVRDYLESFEISKAAKAIEYFVVEDLSNWYIRRSRRRFWKEGWDEDKNSAYKTLFRVLLDLSRLMAPFIPFAAELAYQRLTKGIKQRKESVHLEDYPSFNEELLDQELVSTMDVVRTLANLGRAVRNKVNVKLRQPLRRALLVVPELSERERARRFENLLKEELNVKHVEWLDRLPKEVKIVLKPNFKELGPRFGAKVKEIASALAKCSRDEALKLLEQGELTLTLGEEPIILSPSEVEVLLETMGTLHMESAGKYAVILDAALDEELKKEGIVRDIIHRIQLMRKEAGFEVTDRIMLLVDNQTEEPLKQILREFAPLIQEEVLAREIVFDSISDDRIFKQQFQVSGMQAIIGVKKC
ncbi:MAG: isoleucine--tRNA ligase, partial [Candidatus Atribacteria bacterium]|nr:isoleucine--tRNA ligase [Candidatus Atribacteria bacterium]MCD6350008.1 isoleucine--tRNA ligase [Candidatus Atribacteria bacterium]